MKTSAPAKTHRPPASKRRAAKRPARQTNFNERPTAPDRPRGRVRHDVEVDEARERLPASEAVTLVPLAPTDGLAEELGEDFVRNVTGANDAASELRDPPAPDEADELFMESSGDLGFADATPPLPRKKKEPARS
jgi:hypothetical protein